MNQFHLFGLILSWPPAVILFGIIRLITVLAVVLFGINRLITVLTVP